MTVNLKAELAAGERLVGVLVRMPAEELVEMAGVAQLDFVLIDCEHGPADVIALRRHVTAAQLYGMGVLVRVGQDEPQLIQRALDHGATGIVVPHVEDGAQAAAVVLAARYPPAGERGFATYGRAGGFGTLSAATHLVADADRTMVIAMVESETGCRNAADIAAVPGVDGVMVGTADLAVSMGADGPADAVVVEALAAVHGEVDAAGGACLHIVPDARHAEEALQAGASFVVVNLTHALMELFSTLRSNTRPAAPRRNAK